MTKEEILDKHSLVYNCNHIGRYRNSALAAMEEYAQQQLAPSSAVEILKELCQLKHYKDTVGQDSFYKKTQPELWKRANDFLNSQPAERAAQTDVLLETVKIALSYRDFGVLNEYLESIGEKKIPAPTKTDVATDDDWMKELNDFLDYNLEESKKATGQHEYFMAGWIAALMHVKVNFKPLKQ